MIGNWLTYIYNLLFIAIRQVKLVEFINVLITPFQTGYTELTNYITDARLRSAATWQTLWLEKLLTDALGYEVTISEASGLPFDFQVSGVDFADTTLARGLINRYKMSGKSYTIDYLDIAVIGQWDDYICALTDQFDYAGQWGDYVCAKELSTSITITVSVLWTGPSGGTDGFGGYIRLLDSSNQMVDSHEVTVYGKEEVAFLTGDNDENGYKVEFSFLGAFVEGQAVFPDLAWSENEEMTDPSTDQQTGLYTSDQSIYVQIQPTT